MFITSQLKGLSIEAKSENIYLIIISHSLKNMILWKFRASFLFVRNADSVKLISNYHKNSSLTC